MSHFRVLFISFMLLQLFSCTKAGLDIEDNEEIKLIQRGSKIIEGSEGPVELKIGDITFGSTEVSVNGMDDSKIYYQDYLSSGEKGTFKYAGLIYEIRINSFEEHLLHDDYAFISLRTVSEEIIKIQDPNEIVLDSALISKDEINSYFEAIKQSELSFIRNGEIWNGNDFSSHLEAKYLINESDIKTKFDFKKKIMQNSAESGEPYKVITEVGDTLSLTEWLEL